MDEMRTVTDFSTRATSFILALTEEEKGEMIRGDRGRRGRGRIQEEMGERRGRGGGKI